MGRGMKFTTQKDKGATIVSLSGDIDLECSGEVRGLLIDAVNKGPTVIVELSGVTLIDSSGIASLVEAYQTARRLKRKFALVAINEPMMRVLKLARLDTVFPSFPSVDAAIG